MLRDISRTIRKGEKIAFVGYNGARKTTLIKLLMRLYDPTQGAKDIREYDVDAYRRMYGTVFQDYQLFSATLGENVVKESAPYPQDQLTTALRRRGFGARLESMK